MIKYDIGFSIGDFVQVKRHQGNLFGVVTQITPEFRLGLIITVLTLDTFEIPKECLYTTFTIAFNHMPITKINNKDLIEQLKIKYKLYLLNNS